MNRKKRIIISITGIIIVTLALLGLTYGYYLTRIQGNTNTNSISITTANLRLVYADGSANVLETGIEPSDEVYEKEFTVTNEGNVNIKYGLYLVDVINTFERKEDVKYTLSCTTNGTLPCGTVTSDTTFPSGITQMVTATIEPNKVHTYTFKFTYKDTGTDQSVDMGKELSAKIQIYGENNKGIIVPFENETLAYNIVNNASNNLNGTTLILDGSVESKVANERSASTYGKTNPISYPLELTNASNYYIAYACDYTINASGQFTLGTEECPVTTTTTKYTNSEEMISALKGKYAIWKTSTPITTTNYGSLNRISDNELDFEETKFKYISVNKFTSTEKVLATTEDEYATSYYFRGGVENNYVNFAGMCWRVVRIQGDGSTKLILEDQYAECNDNETENTAARYTGSWNIPTTTGGTTITGNFGYNTNSSSQPLLNYLNKDGKATSYYKSMATAFKNFQEDVLYEYKGDLKAGGWCFADNAYASEKADVITTAPLTEAEKITLQNKKSPYYYDSYVRLYGNTIKTPTLKCNGITMDKFGDNTTDMYVGALTADEIVYAGADTAAMDNYTYYLMNDYQRGKFLKWWTFSPYRFSGSSDVVFYIFNNGILNYLGVNGNGPSFRPTINLKSNITITDGVGTIDDPYIIG